MGYDYYFINETKKQIVGSKKLNMSFEDQTQLIAYLSFCKNDTIRIVGEENELIEREIFGEGPKDYQYIKIHEFKIDLDMDVPDNERLYRAVYNE